MTTIDSDGVSNPFTIQQTKSGTIAECNGLKLDTGGHSNGYHHTAVSFVLKKLTGEMVRLGSSSKWLI
jgi:hypothetical protein